MRGARTDANQQAVVAALRSNGIAVRVTSNVGQGFPDLIVAFRGVTVLLEVKDGSLTPGNRKLTQQEEAFVASWPGLCYVVTSPEEAVRVVVEAARPRPLIPVSA